MGFWSHLYLLVLRCLNMWHRNSLVRGRIPFCLGPGRDRFLQSWGSLTTSLRANSTPSDRAFRVHNVSHFLISLPSHEGLSRCIWEAHCPSIGKKKPLKKLILTRSISSNKSHSAYHCKCSWYIIGICSRFASASAKPIACRKSSGPSKSPVFKVNMRYEDFTRILSSL